MDHPSTTATDPEARLLLASARLEPARDGGEVADILAAGVDWDRLLRLAEAHGLLALLFRKLQADALASVPRPVEIRLWTHQEQLRRKNDRMVTELLALLELLGRSGIRAIPYKGPMLAQSLYGAPELREFGDLDLLLSPADIPRARDLLAARGYASLFPLTPAMQARVFASHAHYHLALRHEVMVELHWKTDAEFPVADLADAAWWNALAHDTLAGMDVLALPPAELAFALLVHGAKHLWEQLNWLGEVAELLRRSPQLDWQWLLAKAQALRARRRIALGLHLLREYFECALPDFVDGWIDADPGLGNLGARIALAWFDATGAQKSAFERLKLNTEIYDSRTQALAHAAQVFGPGLAEWSKYPLPRAFYAAYYPIRLTRLLSKYVASGWSGN